MPRADRSRRATSSRRCRGLRPRPARCSWCTGPSTTTGPSPRASSTAGEHATAAAVREVAEETGLASGSASPLSRPALPDAGGGTKTVHYWIGRAVGRRRRQRLRAERRDRRGRAGCRSTRRATRLTYPLRPRDPRRGARAATQDPGAGRAPPRRRALPQGLAQRRPAAAAAGQPGSAQARAAGAAAGGLRRDAGWSPRRSTRCVADARAVRRRDRLASCELDDRAQRGGRHRRGDPRAADPGRRLDGGRTRPAAGAVHPPAGAAAVFDALGLDDPELEPGSMLVVRTCARVGSCDRAATGSAE